MPILGDHLMGGGEECDFSKFEEWYKTVENQNSNWFGDELQSESVESDTASSTYFYSNSTDDVFSLNSPLNSSASELSPIEQSDFLFSEDITNKLTQFPSYPFDPFEFNRSADECDKIGGIFLNNDEQKPSRSKAVRTGKNQLGGTYLNGKPLSAAKRIQIIEMSSQGIKPCQISRALRVSHGCVSKILSKYQKTGLLSPGKIGGSKPKKSVPSVVTAIAHYKLVRPSIFSWEIREKLIQDRICDINKCPSVSSINRIIRTKLTNPDSMLDNTG